MVESISQADSFQIFLCFFSYLIPGSAQDVDRAFQDVLKRSHMWEEIEALEDHLVGVTSSTKSSGLQTGGLQA